VEAMQEILEKEDSRVGSSNVS